MTQASITEYGPIADLNDLLGYVLGKRQDPEDEWIFRGQRNFEWDLTPKIDRAEYREYRESKKHKWDRRHHEERLLIDFQKGAWPDIALDRSHLWEWLAVAQHHGAATRLLDWTANPLAALYFAVEDQNCGEDGAVWCYHHEGKSWMSEENRDPFRIEDVTSFWPPHVTRRITVQAGCFTAHPEPPAGTDQRWQGERVRIKVAKEYRRVLLRALSKIGVTRSTLFPDLDGLAATTNYRLSMMGHSKLDTP